jgi:prepilin-type N-terminal cleavage/methylation domain-containing protein
MLKLLSKNQGFTLIELMTVMALIAIISGALWGNFFTSLGKGRDSKRKQDLDSVAKALEIYYYDNKRYPATLPTPGYRFEHPSDSNVIYMQKFPGDPQLPAQTYCYTTDVNGTYYKLYANLNNDDDASRLSPLVNCSGLEYDYGISSTNTTPQ